MAEDVQEIEDKPKLTPAQIESIATIGAQLPSMAASADFLKGNTSKLVDIALVTAVRAVEIAAGMYVVGGFDNREAPPWRRAAGGSLAVQTFILAYAMYSQGDRGADVPSSKSAQALINGEEGAYRTVFLHWLGRSAIVGAGMYLAGGRTDVVKQAMAGAAVIELTLFSWAAAQKRRREIGDAAT